MGRKKNAVRGRFKLYRKQADGSLRFVGTVEYNRPVQAPEQWSVARAFELAARNRWDLAHGEVVRTSFESLVDRACEMEG